jgi:hypothetical protein
VCNFGIINGFQTYRIHGSFEDLQKILDEIFEEGLNADVGEFPEIERLRHGQCTMLLKIKVNEGVDRLEHGT